MAEKKLHVIPTAEEIQKFADTQEPTAEEIRKFTDTQDLDSLWIDTGLNDDITVTSFNHVPVDKPKAFFRTHPDRNYRKRTEVYTHKVEGVIGEQHYIVAPTMRGLIEGAR